MHSLHTFGTHFQSQNQSTGASSPKINIIDVRNYFLSLSSGQLSLLDYVKRLVQLVMPATKASSETSFSALRHIKSIFEKR